eukprot:TRINITY_DN4861_c0_g1_i1.p1 TRINITY_DN4861_c0_g1~~TRINITY_DN4861_c0_g1_i1.p1  ORF type:complete len:254 (-),score=41.87 TRINITY_DN4861_c0_g1_i1:22-783(-)
MQYYDLKSSKSRFSLDVYKKLSNFWMRAEDAEGVCGLFSFPGLSLAIQLIQTTQNKTFSPVLIRKMSHQARFFVGIAVLAAASALVSFSTPSNAIKIEIKNVDQILDNAEFVGDLTGVGHHIIFSCSNDGHNALKNLLRSRGWKVCNCPPGGKFGTCERFEGRNDACRAAKERGWYNQYHMTKSDCDALAPPPLEVPKPKPKGKGKSREERIELRNHQLESMIRAVSQDKATIILDTKARSWTASGSNSRNTA